MFELYHYWRSSCSYRVRIALELKEISYQAFAVDLLKKEEVSEKYQEINPQGQVPTLVHTLSSHNRRTVSQSFAIIDYLDRAVVTAYSFFSQDLQKRSQMMSFALAMCDLQPILNLPVVQYLKNIFEAHEDDVLKWQHFFMKKTFDSLEKIAQKEKKKNQCFLFGNEPSLAEIFLIPQMYNARRFGLDIHSYPILQEVEKNCLALKAFEKAHPDCFKP